VSFSLPHRHAIDNGMKKQKSSPHSGPRGMAMTKARSLRTTAKEGEQVVPSDGPDAALSLGIVSQSHGFSLIQHLQAGQIIMILFQLRPRMDLFRSAEN